LKSEHFDPASLWRRLDYDRDLLRELVAVFAEEVSQLLTQIEDGIRAGTPRAVEKASHKLKGSLLQFSAETAVATAQELEEKAQSGVIAGAELLLNRLRHEINMLQEELNAMISDTAPAQGLRKDSRRRTISGE
jgi:HPt (histidine-containing phosphotransfer) domain-containing protein